MNIGVALATFAVVLPAELPDKTFLSAIVLSSRNRPLPVFAGASTGLLVQAAIAVAGGRLLAFAPHRVVAAVVAALFFIGAGWLAFGHESQAEEKGTEIAEREQLLAQPPSPFLRVAGATFLVVVLAEFGDLTQIVIANLSAKTRDPFSVFAGGSAAFILTSALGVGAGRTLTRVVPLTLVRRISAVVLCGLGIWSAVNAAGG